VHHDELLESFFLAIDACPLKWRGGVIWNIIFWSCKDWKKLERKLLRGFCSEIQELGCVEEDRGNGTAEKVDACVYW
jgi:hypothetical protein